MALALAAAAGWGLPQWTGPAGDGALAPAAAASSPPAPSATASQAVPAASTASAAAAQAAPPAARYPIVAASGRDPNEALQQALARVKSQQPPPPVPGIAQAKSLPEAFAAMQAAQREQDAAREREQHQASGAGLNPFAPAAK